MIPSPTESKVGVVLTPQRVVTELEEVKAFNIIPFDVQGQSTLSDYVIICEGRSHAHCRGIAERVEIELKHDGIYPIGREGMKEGNWILMDYVDIILHIFHPQIRSYYNLEAIHEHCPHLSLQQSC